ncbi:MAG: tetratricopeptide repeat protein, partial [Acidimicrobiia bacterium]
IGVNRGHVFAGNVGTEFRRTYTVMGDTVNLAARLMSAAAPGMLYASPMVLNLSSTLFRTEPLEPFHVKGKEQPVQAFAVFEETGVRPPELETNLPFHGREAELEMLVGIVNTCSRVGRGGIMTISGDTGIGKTRLIAEILERCGGMDTLMIQAEPSGVDNPYWAFRDPLRRFLGVERAPQEEMAGRLAAIVEEKASALSWALPLLGDVLHIEIADNATTSEIDPRFRPERTAEALIELLSIGFSRPVAIVAEDGQWLDDASSKLLERVGLAAQERPWTVLVTVRRPDDEFEAMGEEIVLRPLDDETMRRIVIETTQAAPLRPHELVTIVGKAGGNPLFLNEILQVVAESGSAEELPDSLDAVISREIDTLALLPRQVLRYASVLGRRFRRVVLGEFLAPEAIQFDDATMRELGRFLEDEGEGRLAFRHTVVHDIAYRSLPYAKRRGLHARAGAVIERQAGGDLEAVAEYLASHYSQSGEHEKTWRFATIAAEKARRTYANTEAEAHYERALEAARHVGSLSNADVSRLWVALGEVRELAGELETARVALGKGLGTVGSDPARRADIYLKRAGTWMSTGDLSQAKRNVTMGRKGLDPERSDEHLRTLAQLDAFEASVHAAKGDPHRAGKLAKRAVSRAEATGAEEALARAYNVLDFSNFMLGIEAPRYGPRAIEIYNRLGFLERSVNVINNLGAYAYWEGNWGEAIRWYEEAVETARRSGNVIDEALARTNIAEVLIGQRQYAEAADLIEESRRVYEASNADQYSALVDLLDSRVKIGTGDLLDAVNALEKLVRSQSNGSGTPWTSEILATYALALNLAGRPEEALSVLDDPRLSDGGTAAAMVRLRGIAQVSLGDVEQGLEALRQSVEKARGENDLYEELLGVEALNDSISRAGGKPDPQDLQRLADLRRDLGVSEPALV